MLICDNLVKIYQVAGLEVVALQGLDLSVTRGEILGIVGASGSGKSSLLNILGGLDRPSAGQVVVDGQDLLKLSDAALDRYRRRQVGFVWQQPARNLLPYLSVEQNLDLPMAVAGLASGERRQRARGLLERVGLWEHRAHRVAQLSGGQQQRTAIAVALANRPQLLLADEPTGEVDSATAQGLFDLFRELNRTAALTIVVVSHDPQITRQVDRVVAIRDGKTSSELVRDAPAQAVHSSQEAPPSPVAPGGALRGFLRRQVHSSQEAPPSPVAPDYHEYVVLDSAGRLQVPQEYLAQFGIGDRATLEVTREGIMIRPAAGRPVATKPLLPELAEEEPPAQPRGRLNRWWKALTGRRST
ncbi:MAG: ABC transporter ATP-binding protein [Anaerolinea sp.]|nr:ABC transporter ATP-binding protein [Anaerolinea sp.]